MTILKNDHTVLYSCSYVEESWNILNSLCYKYSSSTANSSCLKAALIQVRTGHSGPSPGIRTFDNSH